MSKWENPIKKDYDRLVLGNANKDIDNVTKEENNIIDLNTIMQNNINEEKEDYLDIEYISSPIVGKYNGARAEDFEAMKVAEVSNKYLDFALRDLRQITIR